ncbi:MAG: EamA family transporter [Holophagales bacterium]|nr:EamA family transporter [Holophagales bacterium]MYF06095.1 EamA family transporter [Holophagales bacterium]MYJ25633.1 EamA family transporter [Holophagales bacterium]
MVSLLGIVLVVGATLCFSLFDLLRKKLTGRLSDAFLVMVLALGAVPLYGAWVALQPPAAVSAAYVWPGVASVVCNLGANYGFLRSVRLSGLSAVIPLLSLTPVFTSLLAIPLLGELPGAREWLGIAMVVFGALALQLGERTGERRRPWRLSAGAWWMILVAFLWASALPLDKLATEASNAAFHGLVLHLGVGLSVLTLALRGLREAPRVRRRPEVRAGVRTWALLLTAVVLGAAAQGLQLLALQHAWVGFVETVKRGIGSSLALILGRVFFAEPLTLRKVLTVAVIAAGVAVMLW